MTHGSQVRHGVEEEGDGVAAADGIAGLRQVLGEGDRVFGFDQGHPPPVQLLYVLVDRDVGPRGAAVPEPIAPVAEVGGDDKEVGWVLEVGAEDASVVPFPGGGW